MNRYFTMAADPVLTLQEESEYSYIAGHQKINEDRVLSLLGIVADDVERAADAGKYVSIILPLSQILTAVTGNLDEYSKYSNDLMYALDLATRATPIPAELPKTRGKIKQQAFVKKVYPWLLVWLRQQSAAAIRDPDGLRPYSCGFLDLINEEPVGTPLMLTTSITPS